MSDSRYFGCYSRFSTVDKKNSARLIGADSLVGDAFTIQFDMEDGITTAWLVNKFGSRVGFFDPSMSRQLSILRARDFTLHALLSFVAYSDQPEPGEYWGEVAFICHDPRYDAEFLKFAQSISAMMIDGLRPNVDLSTPEIDSLLNAHGDWKPEGREPMPEIKAGTVVMKDKRSFSEKMVEQGRAGNKGCYTVSYFFVALLIVGFFFLLRALGILSF